MSGGKNITFRDETRPDYNIFDNKEEFFGCHDGKTFGLFENISSGIAVVSRDGLISCSNSYFSYISGYGGNELIGRNFAGLFKGDDSARVEETLSLSFSGWSPGTRLEARFIKKDKSLLWMDLCISSFWEGPDNREFCYVFMHDISAEKMYKESSRIALKKVQILATLAKNDGINRVSALNCYLDLAGEKINPESRQFCGIVGSHMGYIKKYLKFAAQMHDCTLRQPEWQLLSEVFDEVSDFNDRIPLEYDIRFKKVEIFSGHSLVPIFENLFENSIRHGQYTTKVNVDFSEDDSGSISVIWRDNGLGIPFEKKAMIFDKRHGSESGFGLMLVQEILSFSGARIREKGIHGEGALFEITFSPENCRTLGQAD